MKLPEGYTLVEDRTMTIPKGYTPIDTSPKDPNLVERSGQALKERIETVERGTKMMEKGELSYPELGVHGLFTGINGLYDVVGEGLVSLMSAMTPDRVEDFLVEQIETGASALASTDAAKTALEFWQGLSEREKFNFGTAADAAMTVLPPLKTGKRMMTNAIKAEKRELAGKVLDQSPQAKDQRMKENSEGYPESKKFQTQREEDILNTVLTLKGVSGSSKPSKILDAVSTEITRLHGELRKSLGRSEVVLPASVVAKQRAQLVSDFFKANPEYMDARFKSVRSAVFKAYTIGMKEKFDGSPLSLLEARQRMDQALKKMMNEKALFDSQGAVKDIVGVYRRAMNDILENSVEEVNVKPTLRRESNLIEAQNNLTAAGRKEVSTTRALLQQAKAHPFLAMGAMTGSGLTANVLQSEPIGVGLLTGAGLYGATRPQVRKATGAILDTMPLSQATAYGVASSLDGMLKTEEEQ